MRLLEFGLNKCPTFERKKSYSHRSRAESLCEQFYIDSVRQEEILARVDLVVDSLNGNNLEELFRWEQLNSSILYKTY